jgi:hypothetical protein
MKTFLSATLQDTVAPGKGTECNSCDGGAVKTTGQESNQPAATAPDNKPAQPTAPAAEPQKEKVVVMQGPLGLAITEALNKSLAKSTVQSPVQLPGVPGNESFALNHVQANGQINNPDVFIAKINKSVGLVPRTDEKPTVINTLLDCASKVDDIEFVMVEKIENDPSAPQVPQKSVIYMLGENNTAMEAAVVESIQVVVTYRQLPKQ